MKKSEYSIKVLIVLSNFWMIINKKNNFKKFYLVFLIIIINRINYEIIFDTEKRTKSDVTFFLSFKIISN